MGRIAIDITTGFGTVHWEDGVELCGKEKLVHRHDFRALSSQSKHHLELPNRYVEVHWMYNVDSISFIMRLWP
jgi:hypothetical protein